LRVLEGFSRLSQALRKRLSLTQAQMATLLGVSALSAYKWESGQTTPRASQLPKIFGMKGIGTRKAKRLLITAAD